MTDSREPTPQPSPESRYTAYELDFMMSLNETPAADQSRDSLAITTIDPDAVQALRTAAVSSLNARSLLTRNEGELHLGLEARSIAAALTHADRWVDVTFTQESGAARAAFVQAGDAVLHFFKQDLDTYSVQILSGAERLPDAIATLVDSFLADKTASTAVLRRVQGGATDRMTVQVDGEGTWRYGAESERSPEAASLNKTSLNKTSLDTTGLPETDLPKTDLPKTDLPKTSRSEVPGAIHTFMKSDEF